MPKFFRNFRIKSIEFSKVKNYLLYAVGEIILVVAGILIAVYIGEQRERVQLEETKEKAITQVVKDLQLAVKEIEGLKAFYGERDSLFALVLSNKLKTTPEADLSFCSNLITSYVDASISTIGYDAFVKTVTSESNTDSLLLLLNELYLRNLIAINSFTARVADQVEVNMGYIENNFQSFGATGFEMTKEEKEYYLNDWHFKNKVTRMRSMATGNLIKFSCDFEMNAVKTLAYIASTHGKPLKETVNSLAKKFEFRALTMEKPTKDGLFSEMDTIKNAARPIRYSHLMVYNATNKAIKIQVVFVQSQKLEYLLDTFVPPGSIGFSYFEQNDHAYFTDEKNKMIGRVKIGRNNGYVEIK